VALAAAAMGSTAYAADLIVEQAPAEAPALPAASAWDGFYAGVFASRSSGELTTTDNFVTSPYYEDYEGTAVGLQGGYNFHLSDLVVAGFGADIAYNNAETDDPSYVARFDWTGSATARLGLDLGGFMPYALAGVSFASAGLADFPAVTDDNFHVGYTAGLGIEAMLTDNLSVNAEYRYTDYGTQIYDLTNTTTGDFADSSVRIGLNYHPGGEVARPADVEPTAWDGFYTGVFGGYSSGTLTTTDNFVISPYEEDYDGSLVGAQAGYNFHLTDMVVGGFAADIAYNDAATEDPSYVAGIDWSGSVTARVGLDLGGFVPYALAGVSFANADVADAPAVADANGHVGYTAGLGVELMLTDNLSVAAEYRHTDYGTQIYDLTNTTTAALVDDSVRAGVNFHF
jgi:opacity protein-like surface antigen